ncbi:DUF4381 domain-containing protein [Mangrovimicrobium sediminis]|uniref:DUF4381 domain-containing protein n=1 Tax=Mangrovimicrobium sediminis TaxID=2562682 RepID=A0A4Z0M1P5_9GAMM|nr:DUF4381 domain-containing protein [Haliea sp. SAOS-164]TGD73461.1 DUF4381 domain-containing protein [Haliea sp. SAOS-164]
MTPDTGSLDRLHDLVPPPTTPWWPPAPGWMWLAAILGVLLAYLLLRGFLHWQSNRYRREALAALARLDAGDDRAFAQGLASVLKRTALTAYPREQVAPLTGAAWFAFLDAAAGTRFAEGLGAQLEAAMHASSAASWDVPGREQVLHETRRWIREHRPPLPGEPRA